jgi:hypothetical protein
VTEDDIREWYQGNKIPQMKEYWIFPVSAYIHSGVSLSLGNCSFPFDGGGWDTLHVGAVLCSKKEWKTSKKARKYAEGQIETWNDYLSGNVYGFQVTFEGEDVDSCWGFYGDYDSKGGCLDEARSNAEHFAEKKIEKHAKRLKAQIKQNVPIDKRSQCPITA